MATFNLLLLLLSLGVILIGAWSIALARAEVDPGKTRLGRWLFTFSLLMLGGIAILAALIRADALAPLGILSGLLIVGMLWESPEPTLHHGPGQNP